MKYTHYGWFAFCPVKLSDIDSDAPYIEPRWWFLVPIFWLAERLQEFNIGAATMGGHEALWTIKVTGAYKASEIPK